MQRTQQADGSWTPLWFGNQERADEANPIYGTGKVLLALRDLNQSDSPAAQKGMAWLVQSQNDDGGWGGDCRNDEGLLRSSLEETAVAVEALFSADPSPEIANARNRGLTWLIEKVEQGQPLQPSPIGLYFAKLWYFERLYPLIFADSCLRRAAQRVNDGS